MFAYQYERLYAPGPVTFTQSLCTHSFPPLSVNAKARASVRPGAIPGDAVPTPDQ